MGEYRESSRESRELRDPNLRMGPRPLVDIQRQPNLEDYYNPNAGSRGIPPPERYPLPPPEGAPALRREES